MTRQDLLLQLITCTGHSQYKNCFQAFVWSAPSDCILWQQEMGKSKTKLSYCWHISIIRIPAWATGRRRNCAMIAWRNSESQLCAHNFIWDDQEKTAVSTLEMGSLFLWGRTDGPPGCQGIFYSWLLFFLHPFNKDCDKSASKFQPKCLSPYSFQPKGSRTFWRTTAWTNCQEVAQTCK